MILKKGFAEHNRKMERVFFVSPFIPAELLLLWWLHVPEGKNIILYNEKSLQWREIIFTLDEFFCGTTKIECSNCYRGWKPYSI